MKQTMIIWYIFLKIILLKYIYDFDDGIELSLKIQSAEMRLENARELQNIFKSNLKGISKGRFKSKEQKNELENIKLLYESQQAVIKLLDDYCPIASAAKHKAKQGKGLKIETPKQML